MSSLSDFIPGRIKSIQEFEITIGAAATSNTATVTSYDTSKSILIPLGRTTTASAATDYEVKLARTNSTTITGTRAGNTLSVTQRALLVEYV